MDKDKPEPRLRLVSFGSTDETVHVDAPEESLEAAIQRAVSLMFDEWERLYGKWNCETCGRRVKGPGPVPRCATCKAGR